MSGTGASNEARWPRHKDLVAVALHHVACACVRWWVQVLNLKLAERHDWTSCEQSVAHLFGDASGSPPQLGAEHVKAFHQTVALQFVLSARHSSFPRWPGEVGTHGPGRRHTATLSSSQRSADHGT